MKYVIFLFVFCCSFTANAQTEFLDNETYPQISGKRNQIRKNSLFIEGGFGVFIESTLNYERKLGKNDKFLIRAGGGLWITPGSKAKGIVESDTIDYGPSFTPQFPITFDWITHPESNHHFEVGVGFANVLAPILIRVPLMYRLETDNGFLLRAGINADVLFFFFLPSPSLSLSLGYQF